MLNLSEEQQKALMQAVNETYSRRNTKEPKSF